MLLSKTDVKVRKHREQTGLDTLVVYAVNDGCYRLLNCSRLVNTLNTPPSEYDCKIESLRNRRGSFSGGGACNVN
jgi:hypothetical protein